MVRVPPQQACSNEVGRGTGVCFDRAVQYIAKRVMGVSTAVARA